MEERARFYVLSNGFFLLAAETRWPIFNGGGCDFNFTLVFRVLPDRVLHRSLVVSLVVQVLKTLLHFPPFS